MSVSALLMGIRDHLLDETDIKKESLGIHEDGRPIPGFDDYYISIHLAAWIAGNPAVNTGIYEKFAVSCTITKRAVTPQANLMDTLFINELVGVEKILRKLTVAIDLDYLLLKRANAYLDDGRDWIVEPLKWIGNDLPKIVGGEWMFADPSDNRVGFVMSSNFSGAGRDQSYQNEE